MMTADDTQHDAEQTAAAESPPTDFADPPPPWRGDLAWSQAIDMHDDRRPMSWPLRALLAAVGVSAVGLMGLIGAELVIHHQSSDAPPAVAAPSGMTTVTTAPPPITAPVTTTAPPPTSTVTVTTTAPTTTTRYSDGDGEEPPTTFVPPPQTAEPLSPVAEQNSRFLAKIAHDGWDVTNANRAVLVGRGVCTQLASGLSTYDVAKRFQAIDGFPFDAEDDFAVDAASVFCPALMR